MQSAAAASFVYMRMRCSQYAGGRCARVPPANALLQQQLQHSRCRRQLMPGGQALGGLLLRRMHKALIKKKKKKKKKKTLKSWCVYSVTI